MADADTLTLTVRYYAAARAAAGVWSEPIQLPAPATVHDVLQRAVDRHGDRLAQVLNRCSYLLDETAVHGSSTSVADGDTLDVLPPFAGG